MGGCSMSATSAAAWRATYSPAAATPATPATAAAISQTYAATFGNYRNYGFKHGSGGTWRNIG